MNITETFISLQNKQSFVFCFSFDFRKVHPIFFGLVKVSRRKNPVAFGLQKTDNLGLVQNIKKKKSLFLL
jgi:hypothetical protein